MRKKVIVIGSLNYDIILDLPRLPARGETLSALGVSRAAGGKGANQAVQMAKLGMDVYMVGCVGDDAMGNELIRTASEYGVHTEYIQKVSEATGMGVVNAVQNGEVYATIVRGANYAVTKENIDQIKTLLEEAEIVVFQMEIPVDIVKYGIEVAKRAGCKIILNAAPALDMTDRYMEMCEVLVVNEVEAAFYLGHEITTLNAGEKAALTLSNKWKLDCIVTMGSQGAIVVSRNESKVIPAKKVEAIETTGAGDSFIGGVCYGLAMGMNLCEASEFATSVSAITVCGKGAQSSMPFLKDLS
ncbi:ribokinase [Lachnospiraceae bacterium PF1-21]